MNPPFKERHVYRIRSNNLRVGVYVPGAPQPYDAQFLGVREKGHPQAVRLDMEFMGDGSFGTVRRVEKELGRVPSALGPIQRNNEVLLGYLYHLEMSLGFEFVTVEEYEKANEEYLRELEEFEAEQNGKE
jgi:hypothetical protein